LRSLRVMNIVLRSLRVMNIVLRSLPVMNVGRGERTRSVGSADGPKGCPRRRPASLRSRPVFVGGLAFLKRAEALEAAGLSE